MTCVRFDGLNHMSPKHLQFFMLQPRLRLTVLARVYRLHLECGSNTAYASKQRGKLLLCSLLVTMLAAPGILLAHITHIPIVPRSQFPDPKTTPVGFEPTRGDPIGLAGRRLNRSAKVSLMILKTDSKSFEYIFFLIGRFAGRAW